MSTILGAIVVFGYIAVVRRRFTAAEMFVPISLAVTVLWPWWPFRFLVPLAPFAFFYFVVGVGAGRTARIAILVIILLNLGDHAGFIMRRHHAGETSSWVGRYSQVRTTLEWMSSHLDGIGVVATTNPALAHLHTGYPTVTLDVLTEPWAAWKRRKVKYVAPLIGYPLPDQSQGAYRLLYRWPPESETGQWVIELP